MSIAKVRSLLYRFGFTLYSSPAIPIAPLQVAREIIQREP
jgi:hypothetical protein